MSGDKRILSDIEIKNLIEDVKPMSVKSIRNINPKLKEKRMHKEAELNIVSETERNFKLIIRVNTIDMFDFSIILMYTDEQGKSYILRRYNGKHPHKNKLEGTTLWDFHIHYATERYQQQGYRIESYAETTDSYSNWTEALNKMLDDCNFKRDEQLLTSYFG